ncbi:hypothetical protein AZSI13_04580 [Azospira sp. I13]|uniref:tetratricopeptide repeat protein n=1 Tax=Azospira sp. I13 TaxID=1765050 RepID=UPI000D46420E|nr:tetratricopeptide repeat protein [Azospira sp. I13]GBG01131.1 hypothetical protein AZSI13_04580 [Azospira sp. I13]
MSLLMDALKKAEEAKRGGGESPALPPGSVTEVDLKLEPILPAGGALPNLDDHLDTVDADLAAVAASARTPPQASADRSAAAQPASMTHTQEVAIEAERQGARNLFNAKITNDAGPSRQTKIILLVGGLVLALGGIGGFFWYQLQGLNPGGLTRPPPPAAAITAPLPPPAQPVAPVQALTPQPAPATAAPAALPESASTNAPEPVAPVHREAPPPRPQPPQAEASGPIRLSRGKPLGNPVLDQAYAALQREDFASAAQGYDKVLQGDPRNVDALLGLATIAGREGQLQRSEALYQKALEADPKNPVALAGLSTLSGSSDGAAESRLKTIIASQPEAGHAYFALGNLYARQNRWSEAQQAYFKSLGADSENPDYLFNLAVSLDHLRQIRPALQYYQAALGAAESRPAAFDKETARRRLQELSPP